MTSRNPPIEIGFLLTPELALLAFSSAVEPYRAANITSGKELYRWTFLTDNGTAIDAGNGITLTPDQKPDISDRFDRIFVCQNIPSAGCSTTHKTIPALAASVPVPGYWLTQAYCRDTAAPFTGKALMLSEKHSPTSKQTLQCTLSKTIAALAAAAPVLST